MITIEPTDALVIVDVQNTFCPGGTLPVPHGGEVTGPINRVMPLFDPARVWATQDWHPENHLSFASRGGIWPVHAVQNTPDAALRPDLNRAGIGRIVQKGNDPDRESYSGFDGTTLAADLHKAGIKRVFVCGLATDYCVKATVLDARANGFEAIVLSDACRAVNVKPGDDDRALSEMQEAGAILAQTDDLSGLSDPNNGGQRG